MKMTEEPNKWDHNSSDNRLIGELTGESSSKMIEIKYKSLQMQRICLKHTEIITGICLSPLCNNYRQLCNTCQMSHGHKEHFRTWPEAVDQAKKLLKNCLNQLQVTRKRKQADVQNHLRHNMALCQIQKSLEDIEGVIIQKITNFKQSIKSIYSKKVNAKINELDHIMLSSYKALQSQLKNIRDQPYQSLSHIFSRDLEYDVKYYDSYFNQIFINKTRNFKSSLENDRILALIVNFEQNLAKIFNYNLEKGNTDSRQYHLFRTEGEQTLLYTLSKDWQNIQITQLPHHSKLAHLSEKAEYQWQGIPQSIFYQPKNCFYIIGEGRKSSKAIIKWDCSRPINLLEESSEFIDDAFISLRPMQTERRQFAVCELGGEIYIVGGQNQREGCLSRCEKVVPQYNSQIYLIHSLNCKSSRHSLTTYKNKYILKFGGIKTLCPGECDLVSLESISAPPQIFSIQTEEWSIIPVKKDLQMKFGLYPSIFKSQNKNMLLILGGELCEEQSAISVSIEDSKGVVEELKMRTSKSGLVHRGVIFNGTVRVDEEENTCAYMTSEGYMQRITLVKKKLYHWNR